jgi:hypothetical protein
VQNSKIIKECVSEAENTGGCYNINVYLEIIKTIDIEVYEAIQDWPRMKL